MKKYLIIFGIVLVLGLGSFLGAKYYLNKDLKNTNHLNQNFKHILHFPIFVFSVYALMSSSEK